MCFHPQTSLFFLAEISMTTPGHVTAAFSGWQTSHRCTLTSSAVMRLSVCGHLILSTHPSEVSPVQTTNAVSNPAKGCGLNEGKNGRTNTCRGWGFGARNLKTHLLYVHVKHDARTLHLTVLSFCRTGSVREKYIPSWCGTLVP